MSDGGEIPNLLVSEPSGDLRPPADGPHADPRQQRNCPQRRTASGPLPVQGGARPPNATPVSHAAPASTMAALAACDIAGAVPAIVSDQGLLCRISGRTRIARHPIPQHPQNCIKQDIHDQRRRG